MDLYEELAALAKLELRFAEDGTLDRITDVHRRRSEIIEMLPAHPPPHARPALERAAQLQARAASILEKRRADAAEQLEGVRRIRRAASGYAASTGISLALRMRTGRAPMLDRVA